MKIRFNLTVEDFYEYVGTNPSKRLTDRVISSLPYQLKDGYNMKFKVVKNPYSWNTWYRVHITANIEEDDVNFMLLNNERFMHKFHNFSMRRLKI